MWLRLVGRSLNVSLARILPNKFHIASLTYRFRPHPHQFHFRTPSLSPSRSPFLISTLPLHLLPSTFPPRPHPFFSRPSAGSPTVGGGGRGEGCRGGAGEGRRGWGEAVGGSGRRGRAIRNCSNLRQLCRFLQPWKTSSPLQPTFFKSITPFWTFAPSPHHIQQKISQNYRPLPHTTPVSRWWCPLSRAKGRQNNVVESLLIRGDWRAPS